MPYGPFPHGWPYSNFHDLNLDWVIQTVHTLAAEWAQVQQDWTSEQQAFEDFKTYVNNRLAAFQDWFDDLDVQQEINNKIDDMVRSGQLLQIIQSTVTDTTQSAADSWLSENMTPGAGAPALDSSLTLENAAAQAKAVGDRFATTDSTIREYAANVPRALFPDVTWGYYIDNRGTLVAAEFYGYTAPIPLSAGDTLKIKTAGVAGNVTVIATCDSRGENIVPVIVPPDNTYKYYSYTATGDVYLTLGMRQKLQNYIFLDTQSKINDYVGTIDPVMQPIGNNLFNTSQTVDGEYIGARGQRVSEASSQYCVCPVKPGTTLTICYLMAGPGGGLGIGFRDESNRELPGGETLMDYLAEYQWDGRRVYVNVPVPANAYYFTITSKLGSAPWDASNNLYVFYTGMYYYGVTQLFDNSLVDVKSAALVNDNINLSNYSWAMVGDSLTEANAYAAKHYYDYIARKCGLNFINKGQSGGGYARNDWFYLAVNELVGDPFDFATFFGSGNDCNYKAIFGASAVWETSLGQVTDNGTTTICGYINRAIDNFYTKFPLKKLGIITPTPWAVYCTDGQVSGNEMDDYSSALVTICKNRGIPCLDLFHTSGLRPWDETFRTEYYKEGDVQDSGTHPNSRGQQWIADSIYQFIRHYLL